MRIVPAPRSPAVFAAGCSELQVVWTSAASDVRVTVADRVATRNGPAQPGALTIVGLEPGTASRVDFEIDGRRIERGASTLASPGGSELARFATMNDLHLGLHTFGITDRIRERNPTESPSLRCARAAFDEATAWGAQSIFVKGDVIHKAHPTEWEMLSELLDSATVPVHITLGNHEAAHHRHTVSRPILRAMGHDVEPLRTFEFPGLRIVLIDTTIDNSHRGRIDHVHDALVEVVSDGHPALVLHHHQMHLVPIQPVYPRGIHGAPVRRLLDAVAEHNPNVVFASGHTHRHRRHVRRGFTMAELGSTKDYPGTWCGYVVHEGGLEQTVRRVAAPPALAWTESTGQALGGWWSRWSPGRIDDRCFTVSWR